MRSLIASILVASALLSTACVGPAPETSETTGEHREAGSIGEVRQRVPRDQRVGEPPQPTVDVPGAEGLLDVGDARQCGG